MNGTLFLLSLVVVVWELGFALPCPIAAMHIAATTVIAAFTRPLTLDKLIEDLIHTRK